MPAANMKALEILPLDKIATFLASNQQMITPLTLALLQLVVNERSLHPATNLPRRPMIAPAHPRTAIIVQARKGSSRLPGKVLQKLGDRTVLQHVIGRLRMVENADMVVVATTTQALRRRNRRLGAKRQAPWCSAATSMTCSAAI